MSSSPNHLKDLTESWNTFWFAPNKTTTIFWTRAWISLAALVVFTVYALQVDTWFERDGWVDPTLGNQLIGTGMPGTGAEFRLTPFYSHPEWMQPTSFIGIVASLCLLSGRLTHFAGAVSFLALLLLQSRAPLFLERGEPLLLAALLYISLVPSLPIERLFSGETYTEFQGESWLANIAWRLIQVHFALWIAFSLTSMLGYEGWWTGEAVRQLAEDRQGWLPASLSKLMFLESIAHGVILAQIALLLSVPCPPVRFAGPLFLAIFLTAIMLVLGDWPYCLILAATASSIWPISSKALLSPP